MIEEIKRLRCVCEKCRHEWVTREAITPRMCPRCKKVTWNDIGEKASRIESIEQIGNSEPVIKLRDKKEVDTFVSDTYVEVERELVTDDIDF